MDKFKPTPSVGLTKKVNGFLKGRIAKMGREVKIGPSKDWLYFVYELNILDTDLPVTVKSDNGYVEANVEEGEVVSIFATKKLHEKLSVFDEGIVVNITYKGKKESGAKNPAHDFDVKLVKEGK